MINRILIINKKISSSILPGFKFGLISALLTVLMLSACGGTLNNPYPKQQANKSIVYTRFISQPKNLDPAKSYSSNEYAYIGNIYEPPLQYHYLKRPYVLTPLTATKLPVAKYLDKNNRPLAKGANPSQIAFTVYKVTIKKGIRYQPHPAFAKDQHGNFIYHRLSLKTVLSKFSLSDFKKTGSRELVAADYIYQMKRLAHPKLHSPILSTMSKYIVGLGPLAKRLELYYDKLGQRLKILVQLKERLEATGHSPREHQSLVTRMLLSRQHELQVLSSKLAQFIAQQNSKKQKLIEKKIAVVQLEAVLIAKLLSASSSNKDLPKIVKGFLLATKASIQFVDLSKFELSGVTLIDRYSYEIKIKGRYPQILYWLAMPFFSPVPSEAIKFYSQTGMKKRNMKINWWPVGTGAYMLTHNNPSLKIVLQKNPNFRGIPYPSEGSATDRQQGLLKDAGKIMPFVDTVIFTLEKESIPLWNKFLQGYFDLAGINSESFDQAVKINIQGNANLTPGMRSKNIKLITTVDTSTTYMGFNMRDPVVGGTSERARKLRHAISIAMNYKEYINIFLNGRGIEAQDPIPPGIIGYSQGKQGMNTYLFDWVNEKRKRKSIAYAKQLMVEAGYGNGIDQKTGKQLIINFEAVDGGGAQAKAERRWYVKQLNSINIQLQIRGTDYNRFQSKMRNGKSQIFQWGWNADYPDPENFLFLLYGPNGKVKYHGENAVNYDNEEYNKLFKRIETMPNGPQRNKLIKKMIAILRYDAPWIWGFHSKSYVLYHDWYHNAKPHAVAHNTLMFKRIDSQRRNQQRQSWNIPVIWPVWLGFGILLLILLPGIRAYRAKVYDVKHKQQNIESVDKKAAE
ncbi:ABC transporter, substrate-binding protein (cluster 5, nickel/peptides/opines) [hydrothermal vent metagenome]|uniref:ABC transporter, substrate-binding protein (Cluster 5, nickel/peptides/opines) n=1 Tax=hydrothermal vent metagenome TaxID=652676 RepID=A0A3B0YJD4_9ZZZZ